MQDVERVGGKNASLGEMISHLSSAGVSVPGALATAARAYRECRAHDGLDQRIRQLLDELDVDDVQQLARTGEAIRQAIMEAPFPPALDRALEEAWQVLTRDHPDMAVAVRSSATAEDLPDASFAGQQETFLNIRGLDNVRTAVHQVFASLFNDRAIAYR